MSFSHFRRPSFSSPLLFLIFPSCLFFVLFGPALVEGRKVIDPYDQLKRGLGELEQASRVDYKQKETILPKGKWQGLPGSMDPCAVNTYMTPKKGLNPLYLREEHQLIFNGPWSVGRDIFNFFIQPPEDPTVLPRLAPHHRVLEFGCGALRNGGWMIKYLNTSNYFGIEPNEFLYRAGVSYELPFRALEGKKPSLRQSEEEEDPDTAIQSVAKKAGLAEGDAATFDFVIASTIVQHYVAKGMEEKIRILVEALLKARGEDGHLFFIDTLPWSVEHFKDQYALQVHEYKIKSHFVPYTTTVYHIHGEKEG